MTITLSSSTVDVYDFCVLLCVLMMLMKMLLFAREVCKHNDIVFKLNAFFTEHENQATTPPHSQKRSLIMLRESQMLLNKDVEIWWLCIWLLQNQYVQPNKCRNKCKCMMQEHETFFYKFLNRQNRKRKKVTLNKLWNKC